MTLELADRSISYPNGEASNQMEKIFQIFQDLRFDISFADALLLMPRFAPTIKSLLMNKEKLLELAKIPLNENCSVMLLKKLPEKLGDPDKFLIPSCPSQNKTPTRMTLELADRSITYPKGLAEDVFVKVGKFHFPTDFVVVDFEADPRVPLILGRSFLRTDRALIDVYGEEITLRVDNEAVTFNLDQTTRYSSTNDKSVNRIDIIDVVCEEYALEFLGFSNSSGGNPTPTSEPFTSGFILEEIKAYLKDDSISPEIDHADCNPEEDICLIKKLLNNDPFQLPPMDLKQSEVTKAKSSIEEPPELELKDLPSHLEYAFLEENDKLLVIIAKGLKNDEKDALLKETTTTGFEKYLYDSWKSRMELYMMNRPHGRMILASVEKGPLVWPSITVDGVTRLKEYTELTPAEAIQAIVYGYIKNHKKTVKNRQTRTRETEEHAERQGFKAKAKKSQPSVNLRVRIVKSSTLSGSLKQGSLVEARKHKGMWDSTLERLKGAWDASKFLEGSLQGYK
ncbi:reverse transcriptase domain-containing protein [Tanacetum coccineum]